MYSYIKYLLLINLSLTCVESLGVLSECAAARSLCLEWGSAGAGQDVEQWLRHRGLCFL